MRNKKAQSTGLTIIGTITFIIVGFVCVNLLFNEVDTARSSLGCSSPDTISSATKLLCLVVDLTIPYWIWIIMAAGIGFILMRMLL